MNHSFNIKYNFLQPLIYSILIAFGIFVGISISDDNNFYIDKLDDNNIGAGTGRIEEVLRFIESKYVDDIDSDVLIEKALFEILNHLDPHSTYLTEEQLEGVNQQMTGNYKGIGVETISNNDTLVIINVIEGSPAAESSLQVFDRVLEINGSDITGEKLSAESLNLALKGEPGDHIRMNVERAGENGQIDIDMVIDDVSLPSSCTAVMFEDSIAYVKIRHFNAKVYKEFNFALEEIGPENIKHLILDLRGNPGGYLPETAKILSLLFTDREKLLVYTEDRTKRRSEYKSTGTRFYEFNQVAVLVNESSASGSEIMAGAIQDWDRGVIIGQTTFGKGLVQEQYNLKNGGALRLTVARYFTPTGRSIQRPYDKSVLQEDIADSIDYKSYVNRRSLPNHSGIVPDILINKNTDCPSLSNNESVELAYLILDNNNLLQAENEQDMSAVQALVIEEEMASMDSLMYDLNKINPTNPCMMQIAEVIKFQTFKIVGGEEQAIKHSASFDDHIIEAIKMIKDKKLLAKATNQSSPKNN